jgi:hypothetical protein
MTDGNLLIVQSPHPVSASSPNIAIYCIKISPNIAADLLAPLLHIREIIDQNFGTKNGFTIQNLRGFSQSLQE